MKIRGWAFLDIVVGAVVGPIEPRPLGKCKCVYRLPKRPRS